MTAPQWKSSKWVLALLHYLYSLNHLGRVLPLHSEMGIITLNLPATQCSLNTIQGCGRKHLRIMQPVIKPFLAQYKPHGICKILSMLTDTQKEDCILVTSTMPMKMSSSELLNAPPSQVTSCSDLQATSHHPSPGKHLDLH